MKTKHVPVLLQAALNCLQPKTGGTYLDATLGGAGHALKILDSLSQAGKLIAIDQDNLALINFSKQLQTKGFVVIKEENNYTNLLKGKLQVTLIHANFRNLRQVLKQVQIDCLSGVIADLGLSTDQLSEATRGFSFLAESELDMRMDKDLTITAKDLLNGLYKGELQKLFEKLGDISFAGKLAQEIVKMRLSKPITTTGQLKALVQKIVPYKSRKGTNKHPEAKVFQALRIAVNDELNALREFLPQAFETLCPGGKLVIISFHSGEDRIVKNYFKEQVAEDNAKFISKLLKPTVEEIKINARSSSAKLRAIEKLI